MLVPIVVPGVVTAQSIAAANGFHSVASNGSVLSGNGCRIVFGWM